MTASTQSDTSSAISNGHTLYNSACFFNDWLFEKYDHVDLFNMKEDEKERLRTEFLEEMKETAWQDFLDRYELASVEI